MASQELMRQLTGLPDLDAQKRFLAENTSLLDDDIASALKDEADHLMRADVKCSLRTAELLCFLGELTGDPCHRALGLLAEANARSLGLGEYQRALDIYNEAARVYGAQGNRVEQARSQVGKVWSLACLGRYPEAFTIGQWAAEILERHTQWRSLATLIMNLAIAHGRQGDDSQALTLFDKAQSIYAQCGPEAALEWALAEQNRSIVLRNLGRFEESIQASHKSWEIQRKLGYPLQAARAQLNLGRTYFLLGKYNEALERLDQARDAFLADGRQRDAIVADLFTSDCLLQLRRFGDVLEKCQQFRRLFTELGIRFEFGQAVLNEATAYAGLKDYPQALGSLVEARQLFEQEGNQVWVANTDLEWASILYRQGRYQGSMSRAQSCADTFGANQLPVKEAQAHLVAARAAIALGQFEEARRLVTTTLALAETKDIPVLSYQGYQLQAALTESQGDLGAALAAYERAIGELERLRGQLMLEFRADFLEDKGDAYENTVRLCLETKQPVMGLDYVERAKSRALIDSIAYRLDLGIQARTPEDQPLVEELQRLRSRRDQWYRRWGAEDSPGLRGNAPHAEGEGPFIQRDVLALEKRITKLWHKLLIRNADYARDAALWQVRTEPVQAYLDGDTLLVEYFVIQGQFIVFLVSTDTIEAMRLPCDLAQARRLLQFLRLNLKTVAVSGHSPSRITSLMGQAVGILQQLHQLLVAPFSQRLARYQRLIIVPHGPLHYLPFHALHDGGSFLLDRYQVSYLPSGSFLRYCQEAPVADSGTLVVGHSSNGQLPYTLEEANAVVAGWESQALLEGEATRARVQRAVTNRRVVHLATHGDFRADNPLFSGLMLADGYLTTLDVFNLRLKASLVTLSACRTGRSVIGGGDELLGLMRAFLSAGASALVLSQWAVEDRCTAQLMQTFYHKLEAGRTKGAALRDAQLQFVRAEETSDGDVYRHPYFWAPFFLVGDPGPL